MSELRRLSRIAKTYGAHVLAQVEETHLGYTTVRLITSGARLTNLYTVGVVQAGDQVVVEYGTSGVPYIRPVRVQDQAAEALPQAPPLEEPPDQLPENSVITCKLTRASVQIIPANSGSAVKMDKVVFDPLDLANGTGITIPEGGVYLVHGTVTLDDSISQHYYYARPYYGLYLHYFERDSTSHIFGCLNRRALGNGTVLLSLMGLQMLYSGERIQLTIYNNLVYASQNILVSSGKYPILEMWRVSKVEGDGRAIA